MRFTIRDILLLTVIVALVLGWWVDRRNLRLQMLRFHDSRVAVFKEYSDETQEYIGRLQNELSDLRAEKSTKSSEVATGSAGP